MSERVYHVAIADDWTAFTGFGAYEVATRGIPLDEGGYVRATTAAGLLAVLDDRYADLTVPVLVLEIDADALGSLGTSIDQHGSDVRIHGPIPMDPDIVTEHPTSRVNGRWIIDGCSAPS